MIAATKFAGKKIAVFGLGRTGLACIAALEAGGAQVWAWDDNKVAIDKGRKDGLPIVDLREADFSQLDSYVLSPGVPLTHPQPHWSVEKAKQAGVEIVGDTEIFARQIAGTGAKIVAITGTNGKSTTTALIGHVLKENGLDAEIGGNIGTAVFLLSPPTPQKIYVLELSSYQLDLTPGLKADVALLMNLSPDHIDRHGSMENYAAVKARIFAGQSEKDVAVISVDDDWCRAIAAGLPEKNRREISVEQVLDTGVSAPDGVLRDGATRIDLSGMRSLKGKHNWQNACAAYSVGVALGLEARAIEQAMASFGGLVHRMEEVGRIGDVGFINDSKGTNADAAGRALATFNPIYWIAGGRSKEGGIEELAVYFDRVRRAYLIGEAAPDFAKTLDGKVAFEICGTMERAVGAAARDALNEGDKAAVVLLSPACASFDQYPSFEVRGNEFRALVARLDGIELTRGVAA
ncbi:UDP-N-acetylmuramoylalanine--D-glutamate ligase [hydrothermal vent metagenome]|uniref:UDP-N-acetylmuramoylalanine--D-glutamate ligase n=1 Tax=hydrothermal vent metagenome TaxID=652676 RepID=A0A3B0SVN4_9ZZZZ